MAVSAQELSNFVDQVLNATGASKVNIFGHSEGSIVPRYYLKFLDGATKVGKAEKKEKELLCCTPLY